MPENTPKTLYRYAMKKLECVLYVLLFAQVPVVLPAKELSHNADSLYEEFVPQYSAVPDGQENKTEGTQAGSAETAKTGEVLSETEADAAAFGQPQDGVTENKRHFFLTDEKHARFLQENEEYALADSMLNLTWKMLVKTLSKKEYSRLWKTHKVWLDTERNAAANAFLDKIPDIPEEYAYMLTAAAKTQELAQKLWRSPEPGKYSKGGLLVTIGKEDGKFFVQGYGKLPTAEEIPTAAAKGKFSEKPADNAAAHGGQKQLLFRAELPEHGKLWLALTTVSGQKFFLLTLGNALCLVHGKNVFPLDFNGIFVK